jgi:hypothetical protein
MVNSYRIEAVLHQKPIVQCTSTIPIIRLVFFGIPSYLDSEIIKLDINGVNPVVKPNCSSDLT